MLRINPLSSVASAKEYYNTALKQESYYSGEIESGGLWGGRGAERLGLEGSVSREQFFDLLENRDPTTGEKLSDKTRSDRRPGNDFTFSAPKSFSTIAAVTGEKVFDRVFTEAVQETMSELEEDVRVRVRKGGRDETRKGDGLVYAKYLHKTARPTDEGLQKVEPDPHWHQHVIVSNHSFDRIESKWKAADIGQVWKDASYYEAAFDSRLSEKLRGLGFAIERTGPKGWEIAGVPESVRAKFSRRTAEVEKLAEGLGGELTAAAKARLGAQSRQHKANETSLDNLRASWISRLDPEERASLKKTLDAVHPGREPTGPDAKQSLDHSVQATYERKSVVSEKRLMEAALRHGVAGVTLDEAWSEVRRDKRMVSRVVDGERLTTTHHVREEEKRMVAYARDGRGAHAPLVGTDRAIGRDFLNSGQQAAIRHVWESKDAVIAIRGGAGTGKTTLLKETVEGFKANGHAVQVLAPTAEASRDVLRKDGFYDADTVAKFLADEGMQQRVQGGVILIDESGLLGAPTMAKVFDVAKEQKARVVLSGDDRQHKAVERGDATRTLERHAGIVSAEVKEIQRQRGDYKQLVKAIERGDEKGINDGFDRLEQLGWIKEETDDQKRYSALAKEYADKAGGNFPIRNRQRAKTASDAPAGKQSVISVAPTHREGGLVTDAIRSELRERGRLGEKEQAVERWRNLNWDEATRADAVGYEAGQRVRFLKPGGGAKRWEKFEVLGRSGEEVRIRSLDGVKDMALPLDHAEKFQVYERDFIGFSTGDQVRITQGGRTLPGRYGKKHELRTGATYQVAGFEKETGDVRLTNGWVVPKDFGHWNHGYTVTSHASQGKTVDSVLVASSSTSLPAVSREQFYVSASRGKRGVSVYSDDIGQLRKATLDSSARMGALDLAPEKTPTLGRTAGVIEHQQRVRRREHTKQTQSSPPQPAPRESRAKQATPDNVPGN